MKEIRAFFEYVVLVLELWLGYKILSCCLRGGAYKLRKLIGLRQEDELPSRSEEAVRLHQAEEPPPTYEEVVRSRQEEAERSHQEEVVLDLLCSPEGSPKEGAELGGAGTGE